MAKGNGRRKESSDSVQEEFTQAELLEKYGTRRSEDEPLIIRNVVLPQQSQDNLILKSDSKVKLVSESPAHDKTETVRGINEVKYAKGSQSEQWKAEQEAKENALKVKPPRK